MEDQATRNADQRSSKGAIPQANADYSGSAIASDSYECTSGTVPE
jgi:hypothetical protein